jgi:hypothetical protein
MSAPPAGRPARGTLPVDWNGTLVFGALAEEEILPRTVTLLAGGETFTTRYSRSSPRSATPAGS